MLAHPSINGFDPGPTPLEKGLAIKLFNSLSYAIEPSGGELLLGFNVVFISDVVPVFNLKILSTKILFLAVILLYFTL